MQGSADFDGLNNYDDLLQGTRKKMQILSDGDVSENGGKQEKSDEFLRNFFIKFGMKKTLDQFQREWYELKAMGSLDMSLMPSIPPIY